MPRKIDHTTGPHVWTLETDPATGKPVWRGSWYEGNDHPTLEPGERLEINPFYLPIGTVVLVAERNDPEFYKTGVFAPDPDDAPPKAELWEIGIDRTPRRK